MGARDILVKRHKTPRDRARKRERTRKRQFFVPSTFTLTFTCTFTFGMGGRLIGVSVAEPSKEGEPEDLEVEDE